MQQKVSTDVWENEGIMEVVRKIADDTSRELDGGKCFSYSIFHIFTEVIRVSETKEIWHSTKIIWTQIKPFVKYTLTLYCEGTCL